MSIRRDPRSETGASLDKKKMAVGLDNGNHAGLLLENYRSSGELAQR